MAENFEKTEETRHQGCAFFLKRKNRYCKMIPGKRNKYCGEHSYLAQDNQGIPARKRIPCPLDTKHTVFEDQLEKHLKKCNVTKKRNVEYYVANINSGICHNESSWEKLPLRKIPKDDIQNCIDRIKLYFEQGNAVDIKTSVLTEQCLENEINNTSCNHALKKHLHQQSSLIGNLRNSELLKSDSIFVEFGAGRGLLSHWIQKSMKDESNVDFLLVDRASTRYKADSYHRGPEQGPSFHRIQIDIEHLDLDNVPLISNSKQEVTAVSKHLCGAATDLGLRCLLNSPDETECSDDNPDRNEARSTKRLKLGGNRVRGLLFALCCHHCCSWASYVGRTFLENLGFTAYDFHILCCLSSWATCGSRKETRANAKNDTQASENRTTCETVTGAPTELTEDTTGTRGDDHEHRTIEVDEGSCIRALGFTKSQSEDIGRQSKRLIDAGRVWYLKQFDLDASLFYYVDRSVSLENIAIVAYNRRSNFEKESD
ncbi:tRNA:m(4)X modification enzyme TRM13 homolog [Dendronephthya gigantea]|uniref:tRNA:m(4)X modification enzyme TRM13 homolog n=1 Tax=Dendronephthya gigantea TaxID=151771 RepID=UPI00106D8551|nr:tRNA:m(4)X modification enzyme TRM13 homolog [Dendronephthya gigantea]